MKATIKIELRKDYATKEGRQANGLSALHSLSSFYSYLYEHSSLP